MDCTYAVACKGANDNLSYCTQFDPNGNGDKLWKDLYDNGKLTDASLDEKLKGNFEGHTIYPSISIECVIYFGIYRFYFYFSQRCWCGYLWTN